MPKEVNVVMGGVIAHARGRVNAIGAILDFEFLSLELWDNPIDSDVFYAWVTQGFTAKVSTQLCCCFRKREDIQKAIREAGHILQYLPAYSPDINPIEQQIGSG